MNQITIYELLPLLRPGWVAKGAHGWAWFGLKPMPHNDWGCYIPDRSDDDFNFINMFNIAPFDGDWKDSLMECGNHIADASKKVADIKK